MERAFCWTGFKGVYTSRTRCVNSSLDRKEGFQSSCISWALDLTDISVKYEIQSYKTDIVLNEIHF